MSKKFEKSDGVTGIICKFVAPNKVTTKRFRDDWVKIGNSSCLVDIRSIELDNTVVPLPFDIYVTKQTEKYSEVETAIHKQIDRPIKYLNISAIMAILYVILD